MPEVGDQKTEVRRMKTRRYVQLNRKTEKHFKNE